jgi:hypothetical protein
VHFHQGSEKYCEWACELKVPRGCCWGHLPQEQDFRTPQFEVCSLKFLSCGSCSKETIFTISDFKPIHFFSLKFLAKSHHLLITTCTVLNHALFLSKSENLWALAKFGIELWTWIHFVLSPIQQVLMSAPTQCVKYVTFGQQGIHTTMQWYDGGIVVEYCDSYSLVLGNHKVQFFSFCDEHLWLAHHNFYFFYRRFE